MDGPPQGQVQYTTEGDDGECGIYPLLQLLSISLIDNPAMDLESHEEIPPNTVEFEE